MQAALDGSREIAFTIVSMTLSLTAVFIPVLFMGGIVGRLMHEFAVTIAAAILVSGVVSLTLTPMLCSRFLKPPHGARHGRLYNVIERVFDALAARRTAWSLRRRSASRRRRWLVSVAAAGRHGVPVHGRADRVHSERGHRAVERRRSKRSQGIGFDAHGRRTQQQVMDDPGEAIRTSPASRANVASGSGGRLEPRI